MPSVAKLAARPPALVRDKAAPWMKTKVGPSFQYTPTSGGGKFGSRVMGAAVVTTGGGGGVGLIITLMTASETLAALRALRPSTEVSRSEEHTSELQSQ